MSAKRLSIVLILVPLAICAPARAAAVAEPRIEHVRVPSHDGVVLDGWIVRPAGAARVPVVLWSSPYFGQCNLGLLVFSPGQQRCKYPTGDDPDARNGSLGTSSVPVDKLVAAGYGVAMFSVRGTGNSGGCFEWLGPREQRDQAHLVEWLAAREWSSGDVGMIGLSHSGTSALGAAVQRPPHLRTVIAASPSADPSGLLYSPQGATLGSAMYDLFFENLVASTSLAPPAGGSPEHATTEHAAAQSERLCPEVAKVALVAKRGGFAADRDPEFWAQRRLTDRLDRIEASVLLVAGLQDLWGSGEKFAEDDLWRRLPGPKRMLLGQWGHEFPPGFDDRVLAWMDRWLKPGRRRPLRDRVDYQDASGAWRRTRAWPPRRTGALSLPLAGTFRSVPPLDKLLVTEDLLCITDAVVARSEPMTRDTLIAGNPYAELRLSSDQPGGQVSVNLFSLPPGFACDGTTATGGPRRLTLGAADLRFHRDRFAARDFPTGTEQRVRIDLANIAEVVAAGHRIAAVVSFGEPSEYETFPHIASLLTLHHDSKVVLGHGV